MNNNGNKGIKLKLDDINELFSTVHIKITRCLQAIYNAHTRLFIYWPHSLHYDEHFTE